MEAKKGKPLPEKIGSLQCFMNGYQGLFLPPALLHHRHPHIMSNTSRRLHLPTRTPLARPRHLRHIRRLNSGGASTNRAGRIRFGKSRVFNDPGLCESSNLPTSSGSVPVFFFFFYNNTHIYNNHNITQTFGESTQKTTSNPNQPASSSSSCGYCGLSRLKKQVSRPVPTGEEGTYTCPWDRSSQCGRPVCVAGTHRWEGWRCCIYAPQTI